MGTSLHPIIEKINHLYQKIKILTKTKRWDKDFIEKIKYDFTYNSNKLEGNSLTYGETISFLKNITIPQKSQKDLLDLENHQKILDKVFEQYELPFSIDMVKDIHKKLMKDFDQWDYDALPNPGQFKLFENYSILPSGKIKEYMKPNLVEKAIGELINSTNISISLFDIADLEKHPIYIATSFHNKFLNEIHPFQDGNGRVGRILMNLIFLKCNFPPIFIETKDNIEREKYINAIQESEKQQNLTPTLLYFCEKLANSLERKYNYVLEVNKN